jgi:hypothetical protein
MILYHVIVIFNCFVIIIKIHIVLTAPRRRLRGHVAVASLRANPALPPKAFQEKQIPIIRFAFRQ